MSRQFMGRARRNATRGIIVAVGAAVITGLLVQTPAQAVIPDPPAAVDPVPVVKTVDAEGPTNISGSLAADTVWGPQGSPYIVSKAFTIPEGVALTILPGTVVKFTDSEAQMRVRGQLLALGTPNKRVTFTSLKDDSIMGDTNGDGDTTAPARGDWIGVLILSSGIDASSRIRPVSVIDYADMRYGGWGQSYYCQGFGTVDISTAGRAIVSNSSITDSQINGVSSAVRADGMGFAGIYNNTFARSDCGVGLGNGGADVIGNTFDDSFSRAALYGIYPEKARFWFNTVRDEIIAFGSTTARGTTRSDMDIRYNSIEGGIGQVLDPLAQLSDYSLNWWGSDLNVSSLPDCLTQAEADAYQPPIKYVSGSGCPSGSVHPTGYKHTIGPGLSGSPASIPTALSKIHAPKFGPVDTLSGTLTYQTDDLVVEDAGKSLTARRTYKSSSTSGDAGDGWKSAFSEAMSSVPGVTTMSFSDQSSIPFPMDPVVGYTPARGVAAAYSSDTAGTSVTTPDKTTYKFDLTGQLSEMILSDPGHKVDVDHEDGKVSKVTGISDRFIKYARSGGKLQTISDSQGRDVGLHYDDDKLTSVTGVDGKTEHYTYSDGKLTKVTSPSGVVKLAAGYDDEDRVSWIEQQGSGRTDIDYNDGYRTLTRPDGAKIDQRYDTYGRLVSEQVREGSARHVIYDGEGRPVMEVSGIPSVPMTGYSPPAPATIYDRNGDPIKQVDELGRTTVTDFNGRHDPTKITAPDGGVSTYTYDSDGRATSATDARGKEWGIENNNHGQLTKVTDPLGRTRTYAYNGAGDLSASKDELGGTTSYDTDARGLVTSVTDPLDRQKEYGYTLWGQVRKVTQPRGGELVTQFDDDRNVTLITDPRGNITRYTYDSDGRLTKVTDAADKMTVFTYDEMGRPATTTNPRGAVYEQTYTTDGFVKATTGPNDTSTIKTYDPAGRPMRVKDGLGQTTQTVFDRAGQKVKIQTPDGATQTFVYDASGQTTSETNPINGKWASEYDKLGNLTKITDPLGKIETREYDDVGRPIKVTNPRSNATTYSYDDAARTVTAADSIGTVEILKQDAAGRTIKETDGRGAVTSHSYNADGLPASTTDAEGNETAYGYDLAGNLTSETDPRGKVITAQYDPSSRLEKRTYPDSSTEQFTYDAAGNLTKRIDRRGEEWDHDFDLSNRVTKATDPTGAETTYQYDQLGRTTKVTDPTGVTTRVAYDPMGRQAVITDPTDASTVITYDKAGNPLTVTDPAGVKTTNTYDVKSQLLTSAFGGTPTTVYYGYDAVGNPLTRKQGVQTLAWEYDARDQSVAAVDARGKRTTFEFDPAGNRTKEISPAGRVTTWKFDLVNRMTSATDGVGSESKYSYDPAGNLSRVELPRGGKYDFTYDANGHLASQTNPLGKITSFEHNATGNLTKTTTPSGRQVVSTFDAVGHEVARTAGGETREFTYDAAGRMTSAQTGSRTVALAYDSRGLLASSTDVAGQTTYEYDVARRASKTTLPTGDASTYGYTNVGLLSTVRGPVNVNYGYDNRGNVISRAGASTTINASQNFTYDADDRLTSVAAGSGTSVTSTYDDDGRTATTTSALAGVVNPAEGTSTNTYDDAGRLTSSTLKNGETEVSKETYAWDADGNRKSVTKNADPATETTYNDADQQTSTSDGTTYQYDDDGNLTGVDSPGGHHTEYAYNDFGELTSAQTDGQSTSYTRDALGRVGKRTSSGADTTYGYQGTATMLSSVTRSGDTTALIRDARGNLLSEKKGSVTNHTIANIHGDLIGTKAQSGGSLTSTALYSPFGTPTKTGTAPVDIGFQSMPQDSTTGLVDMSARSYDPASANFTSQDTIVGDLNTPVGLNRYTYGQGNPVDMFDPDGHLSLGVPDWVKKAAGKAVDGYHYLVNLGQSVTSAIVGGISNALGGISKALNGTASAAQSAAQRSAQVAKSAAQALQQATSYRGAALLLLGPIAAPVGFSDTIGYLAQHVDMDDVHLALDVAGLVPGVGEIADGANGALYLLEGDTKNALISFGAMAVGVGSAATATRIASRFADRSSNFAIHADELATARIAPTPSASGGGSRYARKTLALDSSSARAYVTNTPVGAQLRSDLAACNLVMCSTAHDEWTSAMVRLAGPNEQALGADLSARLTVVPDNPSVRAAGLQLTRRVGLNDRIIFGTADRLDVPIFTSDASFLRGAAAQGVDFEAILHLPASPSGW